MSYPLSVSSCIEKNKISMNDPILLLLEILIPNPDLTLRIVRNTEDITWRGENWFAYPFNIGSMSESSDGELPRVPIDIATSYDIVQYLEDSNGAEGATVNMYIVHAGHLDDDTPMYELNFGVVGIKIGKETITIDLGADIIILARYPVRTYQKERCQYGEYGDIECGVNPAIKAQYPTCNRSLSDCRIRQNASRWGAFPGIPGGSGVYAKY